MYYRKQLYSILCGRYLNGTSSTYAAHPVAKGTPAPGAAAREFLLQEYLWWEQVVIDIPDEHLVEPLRFLFYPARPVLLEPCAYLGPGGQPQVAVKSDYCGSRLIRVLFVQEITLRPLISALDGEKRRSILPLREQEEDQEDSNPRATQRARKRPRMLSVQNAPPSSPDPLN